MEHSFKLNHLDHVAIKVKDINVSANWYAEVLGLKKYKIPEWGEFPIFMLQDNTGVALFPKAQNQKIVKNIDHFAFNVSNQNFYKAQNWFKEIDLKFRFENHHYFHSIYFFDPDGHEIELTTLVVDAQEFYKYGEHTNL